MKKILLVFDGSNFSEGAFQFAKKIFLILFFLAGATSSTKKTSLWSKSINELILITLPFLVFPIILIVPLLTLVDPNFPALLISWIPIINNTVKTTIGGGNETGWNSEWISLLPYIIFTSIDLLFFFFYSCCIYYAVHFMLFFIHNIKEETQTVSQLLRLITLITN